MSLRLLLTLCGGLEILAGLPALISPSTVVSLLLGGPVDGITGVLARLFGAGVFALGLACLKARHDVASPAGLAMSFGITAYNLLTAVVLLWTAAASGLGGLLLWAAGIGHAALGDRDIETVREEVRDKRGERESSDARRAETRAASPSPIRDQPLCGTPSRVCDVDSHERISNIEELEFPEICISSV